MPSRMLYQGKFTEKDEWLNGKLRSRLAYLEEVIIVPTERLTRSLPFSSEANLCKTNLTRADFSGADLDGVDLSGAKGDVNELEKQAKSLTGAIMSDGSRHA